MKRVMTEAEMLAVPRDGGRACRVHEVQEGWGGMCVAEWGWGTVCNTCVAAKQWCRGRELEGLEQKHPKPTQSKRTMELEDEVKEVQGLYADLELVGAMQAIIDEMWVAMDKLKEWQQDRRAAVGGGESSDSPDDTHRSHRVGK